MRCQIVWPWEASISALTSLSIHFGFPARERRSSCASHSFLI